MARTTHPPHPEQNVQDQLTSPACKIPSDKNSVYNPPPPPKKSPPPNKPTTKPSDELPWTNHTRQSLPDNTYYRKARIDAKKMHNTPYNIYLVCLPIDKRPPPSTKVSPWTQACTMLINNNVSFCKVKLFCHFNRLRLRVWSCHVR